MLASLLDPFNYSFGTFRSYSSDDESNLQKQTSNSQHQSGDERANELERPLMETNDNNENNDSGENDSHIEAEQTRSA